MFVPDQSRLNRSRAGLLASCMILLATPALAQTEPGTAPPPGPAESETQDEFDNDVVVLGDRLPGQVIGNIPPENLLDARDVRATGATDVSELLEAIEPQIGSARGRGGGRPVLLLNGQRISGFRELRDVPAEAIARVEILPEEVALRYGYRADQRVVNFVLRPRFRSTIAQVEGGAATDGGYARGELDLDRLMIGQNGRTMISLDAKANSPLTESERDIAFSGDPGDPDERPFRTLVGSQRLLRGNAVFNRQVGTVSSTATFQLEHSEGRSLLGLSDALLSPVVRDVTNDSAEAGVTFNGTRGRLRWSAIGNTAVERGVTRSEDSDDGSDDRSRFTRRSADLDLMASGPLLRLPGGDASATLRTGLSALELDSKFRQAGVSSASALGRDRLFASANLDLPVSRRGEQFGALGNLGLNFNGEVEELSDFGTLVTVGGGFNWSPLDRLDLIASWTLEEGAPSIQQLGDPILETPDARIFDFTRGETVLATALTGGNPGLSSDSRTVWKIGGNWRPLEETDLRIRAEYVRSQIDDPISSFPGPSAALEAAFPGRFERDPAGELIRVDLRPVNYAQARQQVFRWGLDFSKPLQSRGPTREQVERFRAMRARARGEQPPAPSDGPAEAAPRQSSGEPPQERSGGARAGAQQGGGPRGFGRFGGGRGGRLQLSFTHNLYLEDEVTVGPGLPELDFLAGDALGRFGGRPRHEVEARAGWFNNGLGARLSGNWRSATRVESLGGEDLRFSSFAKLDLRLFANLGQRFDLVSRHPWLRGASVRLEADNLLNARPKVRDSAGTVPLGYQPDLLDPLGRTISLSFRKLFLPRRFRGSASDREGGR